MERWVASALEANRYLLTQEALDILAATIPVVAIKLGPNGAICRQGAQRAHDPGFPLKVVDTTGAGDSFNAGFLYGLLQDWELSRALTLGCACGALSTQAAGGTTAQPTLAQAQALIELRGA